MQYFVYIIGKDLKDTSPYLNCYVGVTNDPKRRWKVHCNSQFTVGQFIRNNSLTYESNMDVIFMGSEEECFEIERSLRPFPMMGLNEAVGGGGGFTKYTPERGKKISSKLAGKVKSLDHKAKISSTRILNGASKGSSNGKAKKWKLISPDGIEYNNCGSVQDLCRDHKLLWSCLNKYKGRQVPPIVHGYGGFRPINDEHLVLRQNSTGWALYEMKEN